jgi:aminoglycoside 6-adenylyltransferase
MRDSEQMLKLILDYAKGDTRIRAVLLNGSRANAKIKPDRFQDFDIVYVVDSIESFMSDPDWINIFGEPLIMQLPDTMFLSTSQNKIPAFHCLILFTDNNRIDLTLFPVSEISSEYAGDSLTELLLDKDDLFINLPPSSDKDYLIKKPTQQEFTDCCNEFWWVSTYVAKGLCRDEITYAKEMLEIPVRSMFLRMIEWHVGAENNYSVCFGKSARFMKNYISPELYEKILYTYPDWRCENIWTSLFLMTGLFSEIAKKVQHSLQFSYKGEEENNARKYLVQQHPETRDH